MIGWNSTPVFMQSVDEHDIDWDESKVRIDSIDKLKNEYSNKVKWNTQFYQEDKFFYFMKHQLDEENQSDNTPIFFNGVNVYLEQQSSLYRNAPRWVHKMVGSESMLKWAANQVGKTKASEVGELTISMLKGEEGHQARELDELIDWLKTQAKPDIICLSNSLLLGLARRLKQEINVPVVCLLLRMHASQSKNPPNPYPSHL